MHASSVVDIMSSLEIRIFFYNCASHRCAVGSAGSRDSGFHEAAANGGGFAGGAVHSYRQPAIPILSLSPLFPSLFARHTTSLESTPRHNPNLAPTRCFPRNTHIPSTPFALTHGRQCYRGDGIVIG